MLKKFVKIFGGDPNKKTIDQFRAVAAKINELEPEFQRLTEAELRAKTDDFQTRIARSVGNMEGLTEKEEFQLQQQALEEILPEAFAVVREASKRTISLRHFDVQLIGGMAMHSGAIAEMRTGEGKTLVATLPIYLNALLGKGIHLVTVNDYLARRDARWMAPILNLLGLSVGVLQMAAVTENGKKAFLVDFERESPQEDQRYLRMVDRRLAYEADVTYGTNAEFGFDYLRDNMTMRLSDRVQRGHHYAIIDEVDNVLVDEARTPLIISGPASGELEWYGRMSQIVKQLRPEDYELNEKDRNVSITEVGLARVEQLLGEPLLDPNRPEAVTLKQARLRGYLEQALRAHFVFKRNKDYLVQGGRVVIVDEFTGRLMPGRRWSDGLHQAVEAKEGVKIEPENITYATVTLQNYYRMYQKLSGMTGTALTEAEEFSKIYNLEVVPIPSNLEYRATGPTADLVEVKAKDEEGYAYTYFAKKEDQAQSPEYFRRKDYPDVIYKTVEAKLRAIVLEIVREHVRGRPILAGTTSVESSGILSSRLKAESIRRLMQITLVRRAWMEANNRQEDGRLIPELQPFNERLEDISPDMLRRFIQPFGLANINPEDTANLMILLDILRLDSRNTERFKKVLQSGVPHQVLNARKHTEESKLIARAGEWGQVTIATNMAGRGVDIILGGFPEPDVLYNVARVIKRVLKNRNQQDELSEEIEYLAEVLRGGVDSIGYATLSFIRRLVLLRKKFPEFTSEEIKIYELEVRAFDEYIDHREQILQLGGLHVIGSERHEARRIDNQLRGRAARQGDPGSSRFYLSLEDDLMRLQGGSQVSGIMERLRVDDTLPLEVRLVGNVIEQSQHRIEGANFDVRKHLLEYDDVLNKQRIQIYGQRDQILTHNDLSEDANEMLTETVNQQVDYLFEALEEPKSPDLDEEEDEEWIHYSRLLGFLSWVDELQPTFSRDESNPRRMYYQWLIRFHKTRQVRGSFFPSFSLKLLIDHILSSPEFKNLEQEKKSWIEDYNEQGPSLFLDTELLRTVLVRITEAALASEQKYVMRTAERELARFEKAFTMRIEEKFDQLESFLDALREEENMDRKVWNDQMQNLATILGIPRDQLKLPAKPTEFEADFQENLRESARRYYFQKTVQGMINFLKNHMNEEDRKLLDLQTRQNPAQNWEELRNQVKSVVDAVFAQRHRRHLGESNDGFIVQQLNNAIDHWTQWHSLREEKPQQPAAQDGLSGVPVTYLINILRQISVSRVNAYQVKTNSGRTKQALYQYEPQYHLKYFYLMAEILDEVIESGTAEDLKKMILDHLVSGQKEQVLVWGRSEVEKQRSLRLADLKNIREELQQTIGMERYDELAQVELKDLKEPERSQLIYVVGKYIFNESYRNLMMNTITSRWVDYLTQIEGLRISIGLEAYAQRDPLVQFKTQAVDKFRGLLEAIRADTANSLLTYPVRSSYDLIEQVDELEQGEEETEDMEDATLTAEAAGGPAEPSSMPTGSSQAEPKRKRRRR